MPNDCTDVKSTLSEDALRHRIRWLLVLFIMALVLSGLTAFPLASEARLLDRWFGESTWMARYFPPMARWLSRVHVGLVNVQAHHPFVLYGTDWLAFAHITIAIAFIGPLREPVKNVWVVEFGMIACVLVIPLALICGPIRGIPLFWQLIDCSFGVIGFMPLALCRRYVKQLQERQQR